jgi:hypothetical protein
MRRRRIQCEHSDDVRGAAAPRRRSTSPNPPAPSHRCSARPHDTTGRTHTLTHPTLLVAAPLGSPHPSQCSSLQGTVALLQTAATAQEHPACGPVLACLLKLAKHMCNGQGQGTAPPAAAAADGSGPHSPQCKEGCVWLAGCTPLQHLLYLPAALQLQVAPGPPWWPSTPTSAGMAGGGSFTAISHSLK